MLCFPHHEDDAENEHSNEKVGEDCPHEIEVGNLHFGHLFYGGTIPLSMNPPGGIRDEKGEMATFSQILTIFYDYGSKSSVERLQWLDFIS